MKVLIFLGLLLFAFAEKDEKRLQEESIHLDCINKGPDYWCQSDVTAAKCHAEKYCKMYVRSKEKVESPNMDTCGYCQNFVDTLHTMIESKATQTEIVAGLKIFCDLLPDSTKSICTAMIDQYGQTIVDDLVKYTKDGKALCIAINLCSADSKRVPVDDRLVMMKKVITDKVFGDYCMPCKEYITDLHSIVSLKKTKSDLVGAMKKMCQFLPGALSTWCPRMVDAYGAQIVDSLFKYTLDPSRPCADFGLCKNRDVQPLLVQIPEESNISPVNNGDYIKFTPESSESVSFDVCTTCQQVVGTLWMLLQNKETQAQVLAGLTAICIELPFGGKTICEELIDDYGKVLINELLAYMQDPRKFCTAVMLCSANSERVVPNNFLVLTQLIKQKVNGDYCLSCKQHIRHVHSMTSSMEMKSDLVRGLKGVCQFLPKAIQSWCVGMVDAKGDRIVNSFIEYTRDPSHFCATVLVCKNRDILPVMPAKSKAVALKESDTCQYCEQVIGTMYLLLNHSTAEIIAGLDAACNSIPGVGKILCEEIVQVYGKTIINDLIGYLKDPRELCKLLHLCPANHKKSQNLRSKNEIIWKHAVKEPESDGLCEACLYGMGYLRSILGSKATEEKIKYELDQLCEKLPEAYTAKCEAFVAEYEDEIIKLLVKGIDPDSICRELQLCSASENDALAPKFGIPCSLCVYGVKIAELSLADKPTQQRIKFALMLLCTKLPSKQVQTECTSAITNYYDELMNVLVTEMKNPKLLCEAVKCTEKVFHLPKGTICDTCVSGIAYADKMLECNQTKALFIGVLNRVCAMTPFADMCKQFATKYASAVFHFLHNQMKDPKKTCTKMHLCASSSKGQNKISPIKDGTFCQVCEIGAQYVGSYLNNNATKSQVLSYLLQVCRLIPIPSVVGECDTLVREEFETIYSYLVAQFQNPEVFCKEIGLCSAARKRISKIPIIPIKDNPVCTVCEIAVQYLDSILKRNQTKAEVKADLLMACASIPIGSLASECQTLVNQNFELIYSFVLKQWENPEAICQELQLCASSGKSVSSLKTGPICEICEDGVEFLLTYMNKSETKTTIKQALDLVCGQLPSQFAAECQNDVNLYFPIAYSIVLQQLANPQTTCQLIKLCPESVKTAIMKPKKANGVVSCEVCELMITKLDDMLNGSRIEDEVKDALDKLCNDLPYKEECTNLVNTYAAKIVDLLVKQMKRPEHVCSLMGLCGSVLKAKNSFTCDICDVTLKELDQMLQKSHKRDLVVKALHHVCARLPKHLNTECNDLVAFYAPQVLRYVADELKEPKNFCKLIKLCPESVKTAIMKPKKANNAVTCEVCELMMKYLDNKLKANRTEAAVKDALDKICSYLPSTLKEECTNLVNTYADSIIRLLVNELAQPEHVCAELGLCRSVLKVSKKLRKHSANGFITCEICEYLIEKVLTQLKGKETKEEIEKEIEVLCDKLPSYSKQCKHIIEKYGADVINMIISKVGKPRVICQKLNYCAAKLKAITHKKRKTKMILGGHDQPASCRLCMFMSGKLDVYLKKTYKKKVIKKILKTICKQTQLNDEMLGSCMRMMDEYEDTIIKLVKKGNLPAFCKKTGQCMSNHGITSPKVMNSNKMCLVCEYSVGVLDTYLSSNATKTKIVSEIKTLCGRVPFKFFVVECKAIFSEYGDEMIELFVEKILAPVTICESVHLC